MSSKFKIPKLNNAYQKLAIQKRVAEREDIFVNLSTETVKPLIYRALPFVFHHGQWGGGGGGIDGWRLTVDG